MKSFRFLSRRTSAWLMGLSWCSASKDTVAAAAVPIRYYRRQVNLRCAHLPVLPPSAAVEGLPWLPYTQGSWPPRHRQPSGWPAHRSSGNHGIKHPPCRIPDAGTPCPELAGRWLQVTSLFLPRIRTAIYGHCILLPTGTVLHGLSVTLSRKHSLILFLLMGNPSALGASYGLSH